MTSVWLAWRTTKRYRARALLAMTGIAIIGALLFDMLLLSHGLVDSFADLLDRAGYDVRVLGSEGLPLARAPVTHATELAADIRRLPEVGAVALVRIERATVSAPNHRDREVTLIGTTETGVRAPWMMAKGADLPAATRSPDSCPTVIARKLAAGWNLEPGAALQIRATLPGRSALPVSTCRVVGTADFPFASADESTVATTMSGLQHIDGGSANDEADLVLVASRPESGPSAAVRAIAPLRPDLRVYSNEDVVAQFNRNGFTYFRQISFVLSSMTLAFTFLLVATLLTVSTNQRLGEIAALRALGIGRQRIASMLLWESALLVAGGGFLALPLGGIVAVELDRLLKQMPGVPERLHFFVFEPSAVAIHAVLLGATALMAACYPIWLTARLPIAPTLRREVIG